MNQLDKIPLYLKEVNSLTDDDAHENGLELVLENDLQGPPLLQLFPSAAIWTSLADALWNAENVLQLPLGKLPYEDEIIGGRVTIEHTILAGKPLEYEGANLKAITLKPLPGRVMRVRCKVHLLNDRDVKTLHDLVRREITFTARWATTDAESAQDAGQMEMGLPTGASDRQSEAERQAQLDAAAGLSPDAAKIVEEIRKDEVEDLSKHVPKDPFEGVPGQKLPQRPKRTGLPAH